MNRFYLLMCACLLGILGSVPLQAATPLSLTKASPTITEDFNSMWDGTEALLPLPDEWRIDRQMTAPRTLNSYASAATEVMYTGGVSLASNAKNGTWNFGSSSDPADRAVGGLSTTVADGTRCISLMTRLLNADEAAISSFAISYNIEKYRDGDNTAGFVVQMYYSTDGTSWTSAGTDFYNYFAPDAATAGAAVVPISTTAVTAKNLKLDIAAGQYLYLAWNISVATGSSPNKAMGLSIDDVQVTATFADPASQSCFIYAEDATKWANLYLYAEGADRPFGDAPGSLPAGTTVRNGVSYKYFELPAPGTYTLTFSDGTAAHQYTATGVAITGDVFYSVNPLTLDVIADPDSYTGWVDPSRPPFVASGIYLRGEVNSWNADADWQFSDEGGGVYALYDKTLSGQFKVADASWSSACNYGSNGTSIQMDTPYTLQLGTNDNISTGSNSYACKRIQLTIADGVATLELQSDDSTEGLTSVYVIGDNNGWNYMDATGELTLTATEGVFSGQVTLHASEGANGRWLIYQRLGMVGPWGNAGGSAATAATTAGTLEKGSNASILTPAGTYEFSFNINTGEYSLTQLESVVSAVTLQPAATILVPTLPEEVKILSLNNSLIHYNDQDDVFNAIAEAMGKNARWTKHSLLGKTLNAHWNEGEGVTPAGSPGAKMLVRSDAWSHIILQEQSALPRTDLATSRANLVKWIEYIRENCPNPNAIIILPMNWAYAGDWENFTDFNTTFVKNYLALAQELGVVVCPVGVAYQNVYETEGSEGALTWFLDDRHPTPKATYMAACMEYGLIFGEDPANISYKPADISAADAASMRQYASAALLGFTNVVDHKAGTIRYSLKAHDQFGMELPVPDDMTVTLSGGGSLSGENVFTADGTLGTYTLTAANTTFTAQAQVTVAEAETEVIIDPAIELSADALTAEENFDGIGNAAEATLPTGWRIDRQTSGPRTVGTFRDADDATMYAGGVSLASNAKNGTWNFGSSDDDTDRALGGITTGVAGGSRAINVYAHYLSTCSQNIVDVTLSYDVEKYRDGSNEAGFDVQLYYSIDGKHWTSAGADFLTHFDADAATAGSADVPSVTVNVTGQLPEPIYRGCDLYLAWNISVASGTACNNAPALAIDNVVISGSLPVIPEAKHYVYVIDETGWDALGLYAWGDSEFFGAWPGITWAGETEVGGYIFKVFPFDTEGGNYSLIFNNWNNGSQLPDYSVTATRDYYFRLTDKVEEFTDHVQTTTVGEHNPANAITYANGIASASTALEVYTIDGRRVAAGERSIDLRPFAKGIYVVRTLDGKAVKKVMR